MSYHNSVERQSVRYERSNKMAIKVIDEKCTGCEECVTVCPCDVFRMDDETGLATVKYIDDCQLCNLCVYYCQFDALELTGDKDGKLILSWS